MIIRMIQPEDAENYMRCMTSLNKKDRRLSTTEEIKVSIETRPSNIITWIGLIDNVVVCSATTIMEKKLRYSELCCHIEDVCVHNDFRNKKLGSKIIAFCLNVALNNNCYKIILNCDTDKKDFYKKLNFKESSIGMIYDKSK